MATNEADLGGRLFPGGEAQRSLTPDSINTIQPSESEAGILESTTIPRQIPPTEAPPHRLDRRGFLKIGLGVGAALGATALGRIIIPGLSSDGDGSGDGGGSSNQPIQTGETPTSQVTQSPVETATPSPTATPEPTKTPEVKKDPTLEDVAAAAGIRIGANLKPYEVTDPKYLDLLSKEFGFVQINSPFTWGSVEPQRGNFKLSPIEQYLKIAESRKLDVTGSPLISAQKQFLPAWIRDGNFDSNEWENIIRAHLGAIVNNFKGRVKNYIVVNEPYREPWSTFDLFRDKFGPQYVDIAFQAVKDADPIVKRILNDYDNEKEKGGRTAQTRDIVSRLNKQGLIDGVGMEMHVQGLYPPNKQDLINTMRSYDAPVYITEMDVNMHGVSGTQEQRFAQQADIYKRIIEAAIESGNCNDITIYDPVDKYSWLEFDNSANGGSKPPSNGGSDSDATPWDSDFNPKPAYTAIFDAFVNAKKK